jgi:Lecithin:cholesterol acyltransferase
VKNTIDTLHAAYLTSRDVSIYVLYSILLIHDVTCAILQYGVMSTNAYAYILLLLLLYPLYCICIYECSNEMYMASYDWRMSPFALEQRDRYMFKLKNMFETSLAISGKPAVMLSHSYGGQVSYIHY